MRRFVLAFALAFALAPIGAYATTYTLNIGTDSPVGESIGYTGTLGGPTPSGYLGTGSHAANGNTYNVFTLAPQPTCEGSGCVSNVETDTITFTLAGLTVNNGVTNYGVGNITETGIFTAAYTSPELSCAVGDGVTQSGSGTSDCFLWTGSTQNYAGTKTLSEAIAGLPGEYLNVQYNNITDWNLTPTITLSVTSTPNGQLVNVPEPASLALLGTAIAGLGLLRRRRRAA